MERSENRILTTHTGSLPRPPALVVLLACCADGATIVQRLLDETIAASTRWVIPKPLTAGIDISNNGEQLREPLFLYVRYRMSGFSGHSSRRPPHDVTRYPVFADLHAQ